MALYEFKFNVNSEAHNSVFGGRTMIAAIYSIATGENVGYMIKSGPVPFINMMAMAVKGRLHSLKEQF